MPRPTPKALTSAATSTDALEIVATVGAIIIAPELGVPLLVTGLATGLIKAAKLNAYLQLANNVLDTLNGTLDLLIKLGELGVIDLPGNCCETLKKGLIYIDEEDNEIGLAQLLMDRLTASHLVEGESPVPISIAQAIEDLKTGLYWKDTDGRIYPLGESLGRLLAHGYMYSSTVP